LRVGDIRSTKLQSQAAPLGQLEIDIDSVREISPRLVQRREAARVDIHRLLKVGIAGNGICEFGAKSAHVRVSRAETRAKLLPVVVSSQVEVLVLCFKGAVL